MSDTRFTILGVALIFAGFLVLGVLGGDHQASLIEAGEFGDCYVYYEDSAPVKTDCAVKVSEQMTFFGVVIALIAAGIAVLVKGVMGRWDNEVRPEDMVGPGDGSSKKDPKG